VRDHRRTGINSKGDDHWALSGERERRAEEPQRELWSVLSKGREVSAGTKKLQEGGKGRAGKKNGRNRPSAMLRERGEKRWREWCERESGEGTGAGAGISRMG